MIYTDQEDPNVETWNKQNEPTKNVYYDLHVFYSRNDGFSVPVEMDVKPSDNILDEDVIRFAVKNELIDSEDAKHVDYVEEIDESEFNELNA